MRAFVSFLVLGSSLVAQTTPEGIEFFEKKIRPMLAEKCYGCHNSKMKTPLGGLRLDTRDGLLQGGDSGKAIVPGDPAASRLVQAVSYKHELKMPPSGKLPDEQIADLEAWVKMGAPDPRDSEAARRRSRRRHMTGPRRANSGRFNRAKPPRFPPWRIRRWVQSPVDAFILSKLEQQGLEACRAGGSTYAAPASHLRSDRTAADPGRDWTRS